MTSRSRRKLRITVLNTAFQAKAVDLAYGVKVHRCRRSTASSGLALTPFFQRRQTLRRLLWSRTFAGGAVDRLTPVRSSQWLAGLLGLAIGFPVLSCGNAAVAQQPQWTPPAPFEASANAAPIRAQGSGSANRGTPNSLRQSGQSASGVAQVGFNQPVANQPANQSAAVVKRNGNSIADAMMNHLGQASQSAAAVQPTATAQPFTAGPSGQPTAARQSASTSDNVEGSWSSIRSTAASPRTGASTTLTAQASPNSAAQNRSAPAPTTVPAPTAAAPKATIPNATPISSNGGVVLRWRTSSLVSGDNEVTQAGHNQASSSSQLTQNPNRGSVASSVQSAAYQTSPSVGNTSNPFRDPFGDQRPRIAQAVPQEPATPPAGGLSVPPALNFPQPTAPSDSGLNPPTLRVPDAGTIQPPALQIPSFPDSPDASLTFPEPSAQDTPMPAEGSDPLAAPELAPAPMNMPEDAQDTPSPFPRTRDDAEQISPSDRYGSGLDEGNRRRGPLSCDEIRTQLRDDTIQRISLDISPSLGRVTSNETQLNDRRAALEKSSQDRDWRNYRGEFVARGRMIDLRREQVVIVTDSGTEQGISITTLSEPDLAYVSEAWALPVVCTVGSDPYVQRSFIPTTFTWKASGLCHKPLYFEEVQLERYGHTAGPLLQPAISSAHFFFNIAVLPYKMGIHPPSECQYALGYYRPGNCAPWMIPPVPISLRGAIAQAAVVTGAAAIIP